MSSKSPAIPTPAALYVRNMRALFRADVKLAQRIDESAEDGTVVVEPSKRGLPTVSVPAPGEGRRIYLHSRVDPEAEAFVLRAGTSAEQGARELDRVVERLVEVPFSGLLVSGKVRRDTRWRLAYDEGGVYWLPAG